MLNEPASTRDDRAVMRSSVAPPSQEDEFQGELRDKVASVMTIEREAFVETEGRTETHSLMLESQLVGSSVIRHNSFCAGPPENVMRTFCKHHEAARYASLEVIIMHVDCREGA